MNNEKSIKLHRIDIFPNRKSKIVNCRFDWFDLLDRHHALQLTNRPLNDRMILHKNLNENCFGFAQQ